MPTRPPKFSREWCGHNLSLLRSRETCRVLSAERDFKIEQIASRGGNRPRSVEDAITISQLRERLGHIAKELTAAHALAESSARAIGVYADVDQYFGVKPPVPARHRGAVKLDAPVARSVKVAAKRTPNYITKIMVPGR
jgi:hypothetical protein